MSEKLTVSWCGKNDFGFVDVRIQGHKNEDGYLISYGTGDKNNIPCTKGDVITAELGKRPGKNGKSYPTIKNIKVLESGGNSAAPSSGGGDNYGGDSDRQDSIMRQTGAKVAAMNANDYRDPSIIIAEAEVYFKYFKDGTVPLPTESGINALEGE